MAKNFDLSQILKDNPNFTRRQQINFVWALSVPGILSQISSIIMQYIDAAMVGSLGANCSASIGLVASSIWVLESLSNAVSIGFTVQVAHAVGAGNKEKAKDILFNALLFCLSFSALISIIATAISSNLPGWLGANASIQKDATTYFTIFALSTPLFQTVWLLSGMLQCSGNMKTPGILNAAICLLDALLNIIFIKFLGLGVKGAALGSAAAALIIAIIIFYCTVIKSDYLNLRNYRNCGRERICILKAIKMGIPIAVEKVAFTGALVAVTRIIAPLGAVALSANSFAVTAEALCYMPGYGIQEAATTLSGQSTGANRKDLTRSFSFMTVFLGMAVMAFMGLVMYFICPAVFTFLTPDENIRSLAVKILRLELFAEPFYAAAIVSTGALRGKGDTLVPSIINLISLWIVRLGLSLLLVRNYGLPGIWIAMAIELTFRGICMFTRLAATNKI